MKITFLGTGTSMGVPVICCKCSTCTSDDEKDKRLRTSLLIETDEKVIVIDTGPDFRQQMLREKVSTLDAILFTHSHKDHIAGLDDVRAYNYFMNKPMDVYASMFTMKSIKNEFSYIFSKDEYPGVPKINLIEISDKPFTINNTEVLPINVLHYKMPVLGFRIGNFSYITDANYISESELDKIYGSEVIIINALRKKKHLTHFTLEEAINIINVLKPKRAYLTHISHQMGKYADIEKELPANIFLAYDGLKIKI